MIISQVTHSDYFGKHFGDTGRQGVSIPAYLENGKLVIGHNELSKKHLSSNAISLDYKSADFELFCWHRYQGAMDFTPFYLHNRQIPFELKRVMCIGGEVFTILEPSHEGTYFCKCKDCGIKFVVDCYESPFYISKDLTVPTVRCLACRENRKIARG